MTRSLSPFDVADSSATTAVNDGDDGEKTIHMASSGLRSPAPVPDAAAAAARPSFDSEQLTAYIKALLDSTLSNAISGDSGRYASWCSEIGSRVKERMLQMQPNGYKYIVITRIDDYKDQTIHAHMKGLWEDGDVVVKERYQNNQVICFCIALAIHIP